MAVAPRQDRPQWIDVEEPLRGERLGRMAAVARLHGERVPQRFVDSRVVRKAPRTGLERGARQHFVRHGDAARADLGLVIDDELRQRIGSIQRLVGVDRRPCGSQPVGRELPFAQFPGRPERRFVRTHLRQRICRSERVGESLQSAVVIVAERMLAERVPLRCPALPVVLRPERRQRVFERHGHQAWIAGRRIDESVDEAPFAVRRRRQIEAPRDGDQPERRSRQIEPTIVAARPGGEKPIDTGAIVDTAASNLPRAEGPQPPLDDRGSAHTRRGQALHGAAEAPHTIRGVRCARVEHHGGIDDDQFLVDVDIRHL